VTAHSSFIIIAI